MLISLFKSNVTDVRSYMQNLHNTKDPILDVIAYGKTTEVAKPPTKTAIDDSSSSDEGCKVKLGD